MLATSRMAKRQNGSASASWNFTAEVVFPSIGDGVTLPLITVELERLERAICELRQQLFLSFAGKQLRSIFHPAGMARVDSKRSGVAE
jgi:hypothetical protein